VPEGTVEGLLSALSQCRIIDLGHQMISGMPVAPSHPAYTFTLARRHGDQPRDDGVSTANELLVMTGHTGTHIDAIGHASRHGMMSCGIRANEAQRGGGGVSPLGVEELDPLVCRGVLLDIAGLYRVDVLEPAYEITAADLEEAAARAGLEVREGDAVLIRTGWGSLWHDPDAFIGSTTGTPGPGADAAAWLVDRGVRVTGDDTLYYEVVRPGVNVRPVHGALLVDAALPIIEALDLESLAGSGHREFGFVASPLKLVGATASPIRPLALVPGFVTAGEPSGAHRG
jgi:kynurenine formamidase